MLLLFHSATSSQLNLIACLHLPQPSKICTPDMTDAMLEMLSAVLHNQLHGAGPSHGAFLFTRLGTCRRYLSSTKGGGRKHFNSRRNLRMKQKPCHEKQYRLTVIHLTWLPDMGLPGVEATSISANGKSGGE